MDQVMAQWAPGNIPHRRPSQRPAASVLSKLPQSIDRSIDTTHRALYIPEILEMIVSFLDPDSLLAIHTVSTTMRATVAVVLKSQYRKSYPCGAIEYHQKIPEGFKWMQLTEPEVLELEIDIRQRSVPGFKPVKRFAYTARVAQAQCLSDATRLAFRNSWNAENNVDRYTPLSLDVSDNRWLDLSQVEVSPYLSHLFGDRAQETDGRLEIKLSTGSHYIARSPLLRPKSLSSLVRPMLATQPPCKSLGIYLYKSEAQDYPVGLRRLALIEAAEGVQIGQLFDALEQHSATVVESWLEDVLHHRRLFAGYHWTDYSLARSTSRELWTPPCDVEPKIVVLFDGPRPQDHRYCLAETLHVLSDIFRPRFKKWRDAFAQWDKGNRNTEG